MRVIGTLALSGDTQAPTQPQNLQATAINRQRVDLSWTASTDNFGVAGYQIFRDGGPLDTTAETTYSDTTATASTTYTYTVVAFDAAGNNSAASAQDQATTPANASPSWQTIAGQILITGDSYSLNLNSVCSDADADTIQYSLLSGTLPSGLTLAGSTISGTPTTAGQALTVTIRAFDGFVNADTTIDYETFDADVTAPPVPAGLSATAAGSSSISASWSASTDAAGSANEFVSGTQDYRVYRSTDGTNFSLRTTTTSTSYSDSGLSAQTQYFYTVTARDAELNESAQSSAVDATTASSSLEADWNARIAGSGVVWFHDFRSDAEVNAFRFTGGFSGGNDPNAVGHAKAGDVRRITTDGMASGACLECLHPAGAGISSVWWRPFSPLVAPGNGKATNDPGANGTITPRAWSPTSGSSTLSSHDTGWYGNALYADADPTHFDGTEFYCQLVVKMDPRRITGGNASNTVGKFIWFTQAHTASSFEPAEHVFWSYGNGGNQGTQNYLRCYVARAGGTDPLDDIDPGPRIQPGSDVAADWYWSGGWDVVLIHIRVGQAGVSTGANATLLEIWAARQGETSYTKIWNQTYSLTNFPNGGRNGIQSFIGSAYNNNFTFPQTFFHRYAQVIFSKNTIPCPQVWPTAVPAWFQNQTTSTWSAINTRLTDLSPAPSGDIFAYSGMVASTDSLISCAQGGHSDSSDNGVYVLNLNTAAPAWARQVASSTSVQIDTPYYADGKPTSRHGYGHQCFIPAGITNGNRWFSPVATHAFGNALSYAKAASYQLGSGAYDAQNFFADYPETFREGNGTSFDSATGLVCVKGSWTFGSGSGYRTFNPATNTYSARIGPLVSRNDGYLNTAIDPVRRIFLIIDTGVLLAYDLAAPSQGPYTISTTGTAVPSGQAPGLEYDPVSGCFLAWSGGSTIYKFLPNATNWRTGAWTISTLTIAGGGVTPTAAYSTGTFGKFRYISALRALVVVNGMSQTPYVFKLPAGAV